VSKVLIVDLGVHQGDGTAVCLASVGGKSGWVGGWVGGFAVPTTRCTMNPKTPAPCCHPCSWDISLLANLASASE
jgi:hypothetical protein